MEQSKIIAVSAVATYFYVQAQGTEVQAAVAYAFDTITFDAKDYDAYNKLAADTLGLSLKTMRNRAVVGKKIAAKYGPKIAAYADGLTVENVSSFGAFFTHEMGLAGEFKRHVDDMLNFLDGAKPAHVQRKEAAETAEATRKALALVKAEKAKQDAEDKAARDADVSGTKDAEPAAVPEASVEVGKPENTPLPVVAEIVPVVPVVADSLLLVNASLDKNGDVIVSIAPDCDVETLAGIIQYLQGQHMAMVAHEKGMLEAAA